MGIDNVSGDILSRINGLSSERPPVLDASLLTRPQADDIELQHYRTATTTLNLEDIIFSGYIVVVCDTSTGTHRPFNSAALRRRISESLHSLSPPGVRASQTLIASR